MANLNNFERVVSNQPWKCIIPPNRNNLMNPVLNQSVPNMTWYSAQRPSCSSASPPESSHSSSIPSPELNESNVDSFINSWILGLSLERLGSPDIRLRSPGSDIRCTGCRNRSCEICAKSSNRQSANTRNGERQVSLRCSPELLASPPHVCHIANPGYQSKCSHQPNCRMYCQTCSIPYCGVCETIEHIEHPSTDLIHAWESAHHQAEKVRSEVSTHINDLLADLDDVKMASTVLDQKVIEVSLEVTAYFDQLKAAANRRKKELLDKIVKTRTTKQEFFSLHGRRLNEVISKLKESVATLTYALKPSVNSNPTDLLVAKDTTDAYLFHVRQNRRRTPKPEESWISFSGGDQNLLNQVARMGSINLNNPGHIGDRRVAARGRTDSCSPPQLNSRSPSKSPTVINQVNGNTKPLPCGRAITASTDKLTVRNPGTVKIFGNNNDSAKNLCRPWGVACDKEGDIIVADRSNNRILIYRSDGVLLKILGSHGAAAGQFDRPAGVAVDARRRIIVADKDNHRIQILTYDGLCVRAFGEKGQAPGQFNYPWDVAVNSECQIVVSDTRNHRVQLFSAHGVFLRKFGYENNPDSWKHFDSPRGIAFNPQGEVLVTDFNNHRLLKIDSDFKTIRTVNLQTNCGGNKQFLRPQGLVIDEIGNIVVADSRNHRIQVFNSVGQLLWKFGSHGNGTQGMDRPSGLALTPEGRVIIVDFGNNRVMMI